MRAERSGEPHLARRVRAAAHPCSVGRNRPGRGLHHLARVRVAYHAPRAVGCGGALPWRRPGDRARPPGSRPAVPQVALRDVDDHAHAPAQHGCDLHPHRRRDRAVCTLVRALETPAHRRAVRGAAGVVLRHVADAVRRWALRLAARGVERAARGHVLPSVISHPEGAAPRGREHTMSAAASRSHPKGWARQITALKGSAAPGPGFSLGTRRAPTMRRRDFLGACGIGLAGIFVPRRPGGGEVFVERWSWAMGQAVHLMVYAGSEQAGLDACAAALAELRRVESRLTLFDAASDLCELNRCAGRTIMRADADLRAVLTLANRFKAITGGAFDVAVEPLMRAWGFHRPRSAAPAAAELREARAAVAAAVVELDGDRVRLPNAHTQLDFGGIGVGYGI